MHKLTYFLFAFLLLTSTFGYSQRRSGRSQQPRAEAPAPAAQDPQRNFTLVIHGGAGTLTRQNMTPEREKAYREVLQQALQAGHEVLRQGGTSLDAVERTVRVMEDSPLFNAGKGAVFTNEGRNELDASIMDGKTGKAGAIAGVTSIKNPISTARRVMEHSEHVMMVGPGAEKFAKEQQMELVDPAYFHTDTRYRQLQQIRDKEKTTLDHSDDKSDNRELIFIEGPKFGTVGAVALDQHGNLAAATSTGGMVNKRYGRVGDTPIIGAGTFADNASCAVSATGHGEYFLRSVVAHDIAALMAYKGLTVQQAADEVVMKKLVEKGGTGGVIALDRHGNLAMPFNTEGMYRGYIKADGRPVVEIYKD
jgi:L-asparaginase / beta-aspartyl-peptidase